METDKLDDSEEKILPVEENAHNFVEPLNLSRDDDQHEHLVPRVRKESLNLRCPCKLNIKLILYIGGIITFLMASVGMVVLLYEVQNVTLLKEELSNAVQKISSLKEELRNDTAQKVSVLEQDLFNTVQKVSLLEVAVFNSCLGSTPDLPATSCQQVLDCNPSASSGHYWIRT